MTTLIPWTFHHPRATEYHIGYIGQSLSDKHPDSARQQINSLYRFGGWSPFGQGKWSFDPATKELKYPSDPAMYPIAEAKLRDEIILVYRSDMWLVLQPDGTFEVARLD